jgi:hypothetical protein
MAKEARELYLPSIPDLPVELRLKIWNFALPEARIVRLGAQHLWDDASNNSHVSDPE